MSMLRNYALVMMLCTVVVPAMAQTATSPVSSAPPAGSNIVMQGTVAISPQSSGYITPDMAAMMMGAGAAQVGTGATSSSGNTSGSGTQQTGH